jgi:transcriptional regulator NrdR family protein
MDCPKCGGRLWCIRTDSYETVIIRRRRCLECREIFLTEEEITLRYIPAQKQGIFQYKQVVMGGLIDGRKTQR